MKNILVFTPHFYPENQILNDLVFSCSNEFKFTVITSFPNYPRREYFKEYKIYKDLFTNKNKNLKIIRLPVIYRRDNNLFFLFLNYLSYIFSSLILTPYLLFKKFDSIFVYLVSPFSITISPLILNILKKTKISIWVLDLWPETLKDYNFIFKQNIINAIFAYTQFFYDKCDYIYVSSPQYSESESLKAFKKKIFFVPQWISSSYENNKINNKLLLKLSKRNFNLFFTGNLGKAQNLNKVFESIKLLNHNNIIKWIFIGDGSEKKNFYEKLKKFNISKNVIFINYVPNSDLKSYLHLANAFLIPLKSSDAFDKVLPSKLLLYLSYGKPILTLASGQISKFIQQNKLGLIAEHDDSGQLVENILKLSKFKKTQLNFINKKSDLVLKKIFNKKKLVHIIKTNSFNS